MPVNDLPGPLFPAKEVRDTQGYLTKLLTPCKTHLTLFEVDQISQSESPV